MPNTNGLLFGGGAMKSVGALPQWLIEHFGGGSGDPAGAYDESATLFRACEIRMNTVASGELKLYAKDGTEIDEHEALDVLHNVNAEWNYSDLWRYTEGGTLMYGAGYWQKVRAGAGPKARLRELFYLNPGTMTAKLTARGIESFTQRPGAGQPPRTFARDDVVYFRGAYDPRADLTGKAGLRWAINAALGEGATEKYLQSFFRNGAVPAVVFASDRPMGDAEIEKAVAWYNRLFRGVANAFKTGFLGNGLKPYTVGSSIRDMELASVRAELRRTICIVTGVPELLISATASADLTPVELALKVLYYTTIVPRWSWYAETLNAELLTEFPDLVASGAYFEFDTTNIEVLQEDATATATRLAGLVAAKIITPEVAALELGYAKEDVPVPAPVPAALAPFAGQGAGPGQGNPPADTVVPGSRTGNTQQPPAAQRALAAKDRGLWERKALNALARGKSAAVTFASDALSAAEHAEIAAALALAENEDDVRAAFEHEEKNLQPGNDAQRQAMFARLAEDGDGGEGRGVLDADKVRSMLSSGESHFFGFTSRDQLRTVSIMLNSRRKGRHEVHITKDGHTHTTVIETQRDILDAFAQLRDKGYSLGDTRKSLDAELFENAMLELRRFNDLSKPS